MSTRSSGASGSSLAVEPEPGATLRQVTFPCRNGRNYDRHITRYRSAFRRFVRARHTLLQAFPVPRRSVAGSGCLTLSEACRGHRQQRLPC